MIDKNKGYIFFIRHGQTEWNVLRKMQGRDDIPLNELGLSQATEAAEGIKNACLKTGFTFNRVVTSPLLRARKTGELIAEAVGCPCVCDERITERDFGVLSGTQYSPNSKAISEDVSVEGLEPMGDVLERVSRFVYDNVKIGESVLAVSHGSATKIFALSIEKAPCVTNYNELLKNCHMIAYSFDGSRVIMEGYNLSPADLESFVRIENE
ncbi:MAG: histidine phosphatase family protein [Clostridia bacterium]|nr:histidine phosphatase family protein [Clostridia bacterium]MBQ7907869.1 histidine phosphatase family protein [Clostridia bacterium]